MCDFQSVDTMRGEQRHLVWYNLGMDLGLLTASCFFREAEDPERKGRYEDIQADVQILKGKILKGDKEADVHEFELDLEKIVEKYKELVGAKIGAL